MVLLKRLCFVGRCLLPAVAALAATMAAASAQTALPVTKLKIVGGLANTTQYKLFEEPFWTRRLAERSGGRVTAEVSAHDTIGIRGPEVLQFTRLGVISFGVASLSQIASEDPEAAAADLVGVNPDIGSLRRTLGAYRDTLAELYRDRYGIEVLSVWTYPAQVVFCNRPIRRLRDLAGLKVRTASASHGDFVESLGGIPVTLPFTGLADAVRKRVVDCVITGTSTGYRIGLHEVMTHVHEATLSWGPNILAANRAVWGALDPAVQAFIKRELQELDAEIWAAAERETAEGIACVTGNGVCTVGPVGRMTAIPVTKEDQAAIRDALISTVLPRWADRCGPDCVEIWNARVGALVGVAAPLPP